MKIYNLFHVSEETFTKVDSETGAMTEHATWTKIGTGFQREGKNNIGLQIDFTPIKKGYLQLIPKKENETNQ